MRKEDKKNVIERKKKDVEQNGCLVKDESQAAAISSVPVLDLSSVGSTLTESVA